MEQLSNANSPQKGTVSSITHKGSAPDKGGTVDIETAFELGASLGMWLSGPVRARVARPAVTASQVLAGLQFVLRPAGSSPAITQWISQSSQFPGTQPGG